MNDLKSFHNHDRQNLVEKDTGLIFENRIDQFPVNPRNLSDRDPGLCVQARYLYLAN